jgi:hypothetical protein
MTRGTAVDSMPPHRPHSRSHCHCHCQHHLPSLSPLFSSTFSSSPTLSSPMTVSLCCWIISISTAPQRDLCPLCSYLPLQLTSQTFRHNSASQRNQCPLAVEEQRSSSTESSRKVPLSRLHSLSDFLSDYRAMCSTVLSSVYSAEETSEQGKRSDAEGSDCVEGTHGSISYLLLPAQCSSSIPPRLTSSLSRRSLSLERRKQTECHSVDVDRLVAELL